MPAHFLSTHHYPTDETPTRRSQWEDEVIAVAQQAGAAGLPLVMTEISAGLGSQYDPPFAGAFIAHTAAAFLGVPNVPTLSYWTFTQVSLFLHYYQPTTSRLTAQLHRATRPPSPFPRAAGTFSRSPDFSPRRGSTPSGSRPSTAFPSRPIAPSRCSPRCLRRASSSTRTPAASRGARARAPRRVARQPSARWTSSRPWTRASARRSSSLRSLRTGEYFRPAFSRPPLSPRAGA